MPQGVEVDMLYASGFDELAQRRIDTARFNITADIGTKQQIAAIVRRSRFFVTPPVAAPCVLREWAPTT